LLKSERLKSYIAFAATLRGPVSIICAAATLVPVLEFFGATIVLRGLLAPGIEVFVVICLAVMVLRAADHFIRKAIIKATFSGHVGSASFLTLGRRGVKLAVIFIAILIVMGTMGVNLTAGIAALGIGGLAIALGSQKSIEHFVGSVTVVADRVVRIGDFCRFGTTLGTVEDIGIRSTRIRTLARTLVTVPNGLFSSVEVENFTNRDKFLFRHLVVLRPGTTRAEVSYCLEKILSMLQKEDIVDEEDLRARLISIESATPRIDVFAYIKVTEILEFLEHQERIILKIMAIVEASGTTIAVPSQMIYRADMADLSGGLNMTGQSLHAKSAKTPVQPR
jgi:MscS family membrane protein